MPTLGTEPEDFRIRSAERADQSGRVIRRRSGLGMGGSDHLLELASKAAVIKAD